MCPLDWIMGCPSMWVNHSFWVCLSGYFWMTVAFEWADWAKWIDLPKVGGHQSMCCGPNITKKVAGERETLLIVTKFAQAPSLAVSAPGAQAFRLGLLSTPSALWLSAFELQHPLSCVSSLHTVDGRTSQPLYRCESIPYLCYICIISVFSVYLYLSIISSK